MSTTALVAYASKHGSTAEIAGNIADILRERGFVTDIAAAADVRSIDRYDVVVIGSAVYLQRWLGDAIDFVRHYEAELSERRVYLFGSGPTGGSPQAEDMLARTLARQPVPPTNIARLMPRIGARDYRTFGGRVGPDFTGYVERNVPRGDWRDLDTIRAWAVDIASETPVSA